MKQTRKGAVLRLPPFGRLKWRQMEYQSTLMESLGTNVEAHGCMGG
ncbi:MAG: hypothetical protein ACR2PT_20960 [Endozoicomonas sp.]